MEIAIVPIEEEANKILGMVPTLMSQIINSYVTLGQVLCDIRDRTLFKFAGSHVTSMDKYFVEARIGRTTGYNCIAVWERFGVGLLDAPPIDFTRLTALLPHKDIDDAEWVVKAAELPKEGWDSEVAELKGKTPPDTCDHAEFYWIRVCKTCGKRFKEETRAPGECVCSCGDRHQYRQSQSSLAS